MTINIFGCISVLKSIVLSLFTTSAVDKPCISKDRERAQLEYLSRERGIDEGLPKEEQKGR